MTKDIKSAQEMNETTSQLLRLLDKEEKKSRFDLWNKYIGPGYKNLAKRVFFLARKISVVRLPKGDQI